MLITLNLVPEREKKEIRLFNLYSAAKNLIFIILLAIIVSAVILLATKIVLNNYLIEVISDQGSLAFTKNYSSQKIRKIKKEIQHVKLVQDNFLPWSVFLVKLGDIVPKGVVLSELEMKSSGNFRVVGIAQTRDDLLKLRDEFIKSGYFERFELPYSALFERTDIKFSFPLQFKKDIAFSLEPL